MISPKTVNSSAAQPVAYDAAGIGLRSPHVKEILDTLPSIPWLEVLTDNYIGKGGPAIEQLLAIREHYPITLHGVQMSLGSVDPLDKSYLQHLKQLSTTLEATWISDHLCWSSFAGKHLNELLPMPFTEEAASHLADRIAQAQEALGQQILVENISSYITMESSEMTEWEFVNDVAQRADCLILLDVNNIYVNACNHDYSASDFLLNIDKTRVAEIHLGGFEEQDNHIVFDSHGAQVQPPVWSLYEKAIEIMGPRPTLIEWDNNIPSLSRLNEERLLAQQVLSHSALSTAISNTMFSNTAISNTMTPAPLSTTPQEVSS